MHLASLSFLFNQIFFPQCCCFFLMQPLRYYGSIPNFWASLTSSFPLFTHSFVRSLASLHTCFLPPTASLYSLVMPLEGMKRSCAQQGGFLLYFPLVELFSPSSHNPIFSSSSLSSSSPSWASQRGCVQVRKEQWYEAKKQNTLSSFLFSPCVRVPEKG